MTVVSTIGTRGPETLGCDIEVDVSDLVPFPGPVMVRGWVRAPVRLDPAKPPVVLFCLPGGRCSTDYFDLEVPGYADYSMADYLATRGFIVVAFDHLGLGASSEVENIALITPGMAGVVNDRAHRFVLDELAGGTLMPELGPLAAVVAVGVGHSMGGMLLTVQQARHATFDAVAVLGHGGIGLPEFLTAAERELADHPPILEQDVVELAQARLAGVSLEGTSAPAPGAFLARDVPKAVRAAYADQQTGHLFACGLTSMLPHATDGEKAEIVVPVFLGFGQNDLIRDFLGSASAYTSCGDITLFVLPGSAHCHNQAALRTVLWDRLAHWSDGISTDRREDGGPPSAISTTMVSR